MSVTTWHDLDPSGNLNLNNGGTFNLNGGTFNYTYDSSGVTASDILETIGGTVDLTANGATLHVDANGSQVLISHDGGFTSALDNLATNDGGLYLNGITQNIQGSLTNYGTLSLANGSAMTVGNAGPGAGSLTNSGGTVGLYSGSDLTINGELTNGGPYPYGGTVNVDASTLTVNGDVSNGGFSSANLNVSDAGKMTVNGNFTNNGTTYAATTSLTGGSSFTVNGNFTNGPLGNFELLGTGNTAMVTGAFSNSNVLEVDAGSKLTAGSWGDLSADGTTGDLADGGTYYMNGGQFLYTNDANGASGVGVLNNVNAALILYNVNGATLTPDAIGSDVLISNDGGTTSALDNLSLNGGTLRLGVPYGYPYYYYNAASGSGVVQNLNAGLTNTGNLYLYNGSSMTTNCMGSAGCGSPGMTGGDLTNGGSTGYGTVVLQNDFGNSMNGNTLNVNGNYEQNTTELVGSNNTLNVTGTFTNDNLVRVDTGSSVMVTGDLGNAVAGAGTIGGTYNMNGGTFFYGTSGMPGTQVTGLNNGAIYLQAAAGVTYGVDPSNGSTVMFSNDGGTHSALNNLSTITNGELYLSGVTQNVSGSLNITNNAGPNQGLFLYSNGVTGSEMTVGYGGSGSLSNTNNGGYSSYRSYVVVDNSSLTVNGGFTQTNNNWGASTSLSAGTMTVNGDLTNTNNYYWGSSVTLSNTSSLNVTGNFTNTDNYGDYRANFELLGSGNTATIGGTFTNDGNLEVDTGSSVTVVGGLTNVDSLGNLTTISPAGATYNLAGGTLAYTGNAVTNIGSGVGVTLNNSGGLLPDGIGSTVMFSADNGATSAFDNLNTISGALTLNTNEIQNISGALTVNAGGGLTIENNSSMTTGGAVTLGAGSSLSIANTSSMTTGGDLNTSGAVSLNGSDTLTIGGNLVVNSGGSYIENSNDTGRATGLTSKGTFELLGGSTFTLTGPWASLTNTGELTSGNYEFEGNSKFQYNNPVINTIVTIDHGVSLEISDTSLITPDGTTDALTTLAVNNGTLELEYGYALNLVGGLTNGGNLYVGNYYASPGTAGSLTVNGDFINNAGALVQVAGGFDYEAGGTMTTTGNFTNAAGATVEVNGGYVYAGGQLTVGGNFNNAGSMSIGGGYYSDNASVSVGGTFTNSGSLVLGENAEGSSYPGGFLSTLGFSNSGYTEVDPGAEILVGANGWSDITAGSLGNGGSYVIEGLLEAPNATITDIQNGVSLEMVDAGLITPDGTTNGLANLTSNEGALTFYDASLNTTPIGGTFTNSGAFTMNGSSVANTVTVNGNFTNNDGGAVSIGSSNKTLSVTGNFTNGNGTSGTLVIGGGYDQGYNADVVSVGGNLTNNAGAMVTVGGGFDAAGSSLTTTGNFTNAGTVQIEGGQEFANSEAQVNVGGNFNNSGTLHLTGYGSNSAPGGLLTTMGFTNTGTAQLDPGSEILVTGPAGSFTNVDGPGNLNLGTYIVEGGILSYMGSAITSSGVTSPTNLEYGDGAVITNDGVHDALTALNTIGSMGTLTLDNGQVLGLTDTGGLTNDGTLTLSGAASLTTAGAMTNSGTLNINQSNSSTPTSLTVNGDLTNSGPITIQGNTNSYDVPGGTLTVNGNVINQVGGAITVGGGGYYTNDGALMTTTGNFTNSGMVEIDGAQGWYSPGRMTVGGNFDNALGGTLHLTTGNAYSGFLQTAGFSNEGTVNLDEAAEISVTGTGTVSNSGILNINSNGSSYTGLLTMAGNFTNSGTATINPGGEIQVLGNAGDTNTGTITLVGQPSTSVPQAVYTTNGSFTNAVGGVVTVQSSWSNGNQFTTGGGFTNNGTLEVYGGQYWGNAPGQVHVGGNFSNTGTMDLDVGYYGGNSYGGQLLVAGNWSDLSPSGELSGGGTFNIGGLFQYNGPSGVTSIDSGINLTFSSSGEIENGSTNALAGLGANAGNLEFDETNETFTPAGGTFTNSGTLTLGGTSGETITINGTLSNTGTVSLTGPNVTLNDDMNNSGAVTLSGVGDIQNVTGNYNNNSLGTLTFSGSNGQVNVASG